MTQPALPPIHSDFGIANNIRMPEFIVSYRRITSYVWPTRDMDRIHTARKLYNEGSVEMCQARVGEYFVLYAIPRKVKTTRHLHDMFFNG
jgi:hypothetical protein